MFPQIDRSQAVHTLRRALPYVLLAALTWIAHFWHFRQFGLYEDDYHFIARYFDAPLGSFPSLALRALIHWPGGRPLQTIFPAAAGMLIFPFGGLPLLYIAAFVITLISVVLFYRLILRVTNVPLVSLLGTLMFVLFPADTTHTFLEHAFLIRISLVFALGASLLYLQGRSVAAYLLAFACLMYYETTFLVFLSVPLLKLEWESARGWREYLRHGAICAALIGLSMVARMFNAEERVVAAMGGLRAIALLLPEQLLFGPVWVIRQMLWGPMTRILAWSWSSYVLMMISIPLFYAALRWASQRAPHGETQPLAVLPTLPANAPYSIAPLLRLLAASGAMLIMAYLLSFTHHVDFVYGRLTSVHSAAAVGASLLFAAAAYGMLLYLKLPALRQVALVFLAMWFGLLIGYRYSIQEDFALSWVTQRWYWTNVVALCHDLDDGTVILVEGDLPRTLFILANSWANPLVFPQLYRFPSEWVRQPIVLPISMTRIGTEEGTPYAYFDNRRIGFELEQGNVILLRYDGERLVPVDAPTATVDGVMLHLRQPSGDAPTYPQRPLHDLLIDPSLLD